MNSPTRRTYTSSLFRDRSLVSTRRHLIFALACAALAASQASAQQFVRLDYNLSLPSRARDTLFLELFDDRPLTQANFMQYVNADRYDGSFMHRLSRNFIIQGGGYYPVFVSEPPPVNVSLDPTATVDLDGNPGTPNPTVPNESGNLPLRSNLRGTVTMATVGGNPNSATNQWFVNLANNAFLDMQNGGFTVFGRVLGDGMAMFDTFNTLSIANLNPDNNNDGIREPGPFGLSANDGVPFLNTAGGPILIEIEDAERIDFLGAGSTTIVPAGGLTFSTRDAFIDSGAILTGTGALIVGAGRTLGVREGISLGRELVNQGALEPGLQLGSIKAQSFRQDPGATLEIQLLGTSADTQYDQLFVTNGALLNGDLNVSLLGGFVPDIGDQFNILVAGSLSGTFENIHLPFLPPGLAWDIITTATSFSLSVVAVPEPSAVALVMIAILIGARRRGRVSHC